MKKISCHTHRCPTWPAQLVALLFLASCIVYAETPEDTSALAALLQQARDPLLQREFATDAPVLKAVYARHHNEPLWLDRLRPTQQAENILQAMVAADAEGLNPRDYAATRLLDALRHEVSADSESQLDVAISVSVLKFVSHLHYGRIDPKAAGFDMPARAHSFDRAGMLERLSSVGDTQAVLSEAEPQFQHYKFLKSALTRYRLLASHAPIALPKPRANSAKLGEAYEGAPALRKLLVAFGDLEDDAGAEDATLQMDDRLIEALKRFQFRHGLKQDGALGKETYAALNVPIVSRIRQIELTLERWRWLPAFDGPTIIVNIPQFRLFAFTSYEDSESQMTTMDVIVGQDYPRTQTPAFAADMQYVIFRPYWDVPQSILRREELPRIRFHPEYLATEDLEIVAAGDDAGASLPATKENLAALERGDLRLRQRPGPNNALGLIKFVLPNQYNVYLHSTPAQRLFAQSRRAFSHGCIRVSDPIGLAEYVLRNAASEWPREKIEAAMAGPQNSLRVNLKRDVKVFIVYGTAVATERNGVYFFEDLYDDDARLSRLLGK